MHGIDFTSFFSRSRNIFGRIAYNLGRTVEAFLENSTFGLSVSRRDRRRLGRLHALAPHHPPDPMDHHRRETESKGDLSGLSQPSELDRHHDGDGRPWERNNTSPFFYEVGIGLHASDQHLRLGTGFSHHATLHPRRHQGST